VDQPKSQTVKIKLGDSSKITIKLGIRDSAGNTPAPSTPNDGAAAQGVVVHNEALERQQQMVTAGMNGVRGSANPPTASPSASAASPPQQTNGVKPDAATAHRAVSSGPRTLPLLPSAMGSSYAPANSYHTTAYYDGPPPGLIASKNRSSEQGMLASNRCDTLANPSDSTDYLLPYTQLSSHPSLSLANPFKARIPASKTSLHQSVTFTLSGSHAFLQLVPHIPVGLTTRPYRLFITSNGTRLSEVVRPAAGDRDKTKPIFEIRLERGAVNKVEVEILAGKAEVRPGEKDDVQWEKLTCFIHCLRV
jgi:hypothetical protein